MKQVLHELDQLRRRTRQMLILQRAAVLAAWGLGAIVVLIFIDYALRLPSALRLILLVAGLGLLAVGVFRYFLTAIGFRPSLTQLALRVERSLPGLSGRLASSVEFAQAGTDQTNPLAARSVRDAQSRLSGESVRTIIAPGRTVRDLGIAASVIGVALVLAIASPATARTGLTRLLVPYGATQWPARTAVASLMHQVLRNNAVHPRGQVLALRAQNLTEGEVGDRVDVHYRMIEDGSNGDWEHAVLSHQGNGVHERLVDTDAQAIELYFATEDARTRTERIELVPPPAFTRASLRVTPPAYAESRRFELTTELGPGLDDRAVTEMPSLIGSQAEIVFDLNKPLPVPAGGAERLEWVRDTFGWTPDDDVPAFAEIPPAGARAPHRWRLAWRLGGTRTLAVTLRDEYGLTSTEPINYRITAEDDHLPSVTITEPPSDLAVLATAVVTVNGEAKDDVGIARLGLRAATIRRSAPGVEETLSFTPERSLAEENIAEASIQAELELASFGLGEGDAVLITAVADDVYELDGARHDTVVSPVRRLRIISELDFAAQLRRQLSAIRQNAIRLESLQAEIQDDLIDHGVQPGLEQAQGQIGDRIATQREAIDDLVEQAEWNRLDDEQIEGLLQQSRDLLDYAGRAANKAAEAIAGREAEQAGDGTEAEDGGETDMAQGRERRPGSDAKAAQGGGERRAGETGGRKGGAGEGQSQDGERSDAGEDGDRAKDAEGADEADEPEIRAPREEDRPIADAQQSVREELSDLIELLDRDEDTWIVQRQLENLLDAQAELQAETAQLARETLGQALEDLTEDQRSELDRIVQRQRELPEQARQLIEEMRRRAEALQDLDPQASSGMRSAADTGEASEVDGEMQAAADKAEQNQLQGAAGSQQAAAQSLQQMLQDLEETRRARAEELLRQLASLIESIDRLIVVQENELIALANGVENENFSGRDRAMIRLNQNTQSVAVEARAAGQESRRIARTLDRAADAQGAAVVALRAQPIEPEAARTAEERSLELLKEARAFADELQEQTEQDQTREEREALIAAYRELAEKQIAVREETLTLVGPEELDRRQLVESRRIGNAQQEIRNGLGDMQARTRELEDSEVFKYVHRLMDEWCGAVSDSLWEGRADIDVTDRQQMIADSILRQIEALEESITPPDEFAEDQQQQPGGEGGAPSPPQLIPPVAEVKRLQGLQEQVYDQTRGIDGRTDLAPAQRRQRVRELGRMQRELMEIGQRILESLESDAGPGNLEPVPGDGTDETGDPDGDPSSDPTNDPEPASDNEGTNER